MEIGQNNQQLQNKQNQKILKNSFDISINSIENSFTSYEDKLLKINKKQESTLQSHYQKSPILQAKEDLYKITHNDCINDDYQYSQKFLFANFKLNGSDETQEIQSQDVKQQNEISLNDKSENLFISAILPDVTNRQKKQQNLNFLKPQNKKDNNQNQVYNSSQNISSFKNNSYLQKNNSGARALKRLFKKKAEIPKMYYVVEMLRKQRIEQNYGKKILETSIISRFNRFKLEQSKILNDVSYHPDKRYSHLNSDKQKQNCSINIQENIQDQNTSFYMQYLTQKVTQCQKNRIAFIQDNTMGKIKNYFKNFKLKFIALYYSIPTFSPINPLSIFIDVISLLVIMSWFFFFSLHIGFQLETQKIYILNVYKFFSCIWSVFEIIMRFNIGYYDKGIDILDRKQIFYNYKNSILCYDIIGVFVLVYYILYDEQSFIMYIVEIIYFLKYKNYEIVLNRLQYVYQLIYEVSSIQKLFNLLYKIIILCHWVGTFYHLTAKIELYLGYSETWLTEEQIDHNTCLSRYINSMYWAMSTLLLIGSKYQTDLEITFICVTLLITVGVFAYILSSISLIISENNKKTEEYNQDMELTNQFLRENNIPKVIQSKIISHLEYLFKDKEKMKRTNNINNVLDKLPSNIYEQIQTHINTTLVDKIDFFQHNFSESTKNKIAGYFSKSTYVTNDMIIKPMSQQSNYQNEDDEKDLSLFIIQHGQVEISLYNSRTKMNYPIKILGPGDTFGDFNFISGLYYDFQARSSSFVTVHKIQRKDFLQILQKKPKEYEKFLFIKEQLCQVGISPYFKRQCFICTSQYHQETECTCLQYSPNKQIIYQKYLVDQRCAQIHQSRYLRVRQKIQAKNIKNRLLEVSEKIVNRPEFKEFIDNNDKNIHRFVIDIMSSQNYDDNSIDNFSYDKDQTDGNNVYTQNSLSSKTKFNSNNINLINANQSVINMEIQQDQNASSGKEDDEQQYKKQQIPQEINVLQQNNKKQKQQSKHLKAYQIQSTLNDNKNSNQIIPLQPCIVQRSSSDEQINSIKTFKVNECNFKNNDNTDLSNLQSAFQNMSEQFQNLQKYIKTDTYNQLSSYSKQQRHSKKQKEDSIKIHSLNSITQNQISSKNQKKRNKKSEFSFIQPAQSSSKIRNITHSFSNKFPSSNLVNINKVQFNDNASKNSIFSTKSNRTTKKRYFLRNKNYDKNLADFYFFGIDSFFQEGFQIFYPKNNPKNVLQQLSRQQNNEFSIHRSSSLKNQNQIQFKLQYKKKLKEVQQNSIKQYYLQKQEPIFFQYE